MTFEKAKAILKNKYYGTVKSTGRNQIRIDYKYPEMSEKNHSIECTKSEMIELVKTDEADSKFTDSYFTGEKPELTDEDKELLIKYRGYAKEDLE